jgi:hypothetical protein
MGSNLGNFGTWDKVSKIWPSYIITIRCDGKYISMLRN